jgi:hypothetical protein
MSHPSPRRLLPVRPAFPNSQRALVVASLLLRPDVSRMGDPR